MNDQECKNFVEELIASYPSIEGLAKSNSPDLAATHRGWAKAWRDLSIDDCRAVLDQLQRGILPQPAYEDKESPGVWIRRLVQRKNGLKSEAEIVSQRESIDAKRKRQRDYAAAGCSMLKAFEAMKIGRHVEEALKLV